MYELRRYGKYSYGERIMSSNKLKPVLIWLKDVVKINSYKVERHDFSFVLTNQWGTKLFRIFKVKDSK